MKVIDDELETTVNDIEDYFHHDQKTAYIFTSAYGGSTKLFDGKHLQMGLFLTWGAGIMKGQGLDLLKDYSVNQSNIAPLVATLLDIDFPIHSDGQIPLSTLVNFFDSTVKNCVKARIANGLQLHEKIMKHHKNIGNSLTKKAFGGLDNDHISSLILRINELVRQFASNSAYELAHDFLQHCHRALEYLDEYGKSSNNFSICLLYILFIVITFLVSIGSFLTFRRWKTSVMIGGIASLACYTLGGSLSSVVMVFLEIGIISNLHGYGIIMKPHPHLTT